MKIRNLHGWSLTAAEARALQEKLRRRVARRGRSGKPRWVAGADVSYNKFSPRLYAAVVVLDMHTLETVEEVGVEAKATFPYVPGLLSFREIPPLLRIFRRLRHTPDVLVCDGHGWAHPRRFGLACHLGLLLNVPSLGCAKSILVGTHEAPADERGSFAPLKDGREIIGSALRTRARTRPVFVSVGHAISLPAARRVVLDLTPRYRLPETTRRAHRLVNEMRSRGLKSHCAP